MKSASSSSNAVRLVVKSRAQTGLRRLLLQIEDSHGESTTNRRLAHIHAIFKQLLVQPRMFATRPDLTSYDQGRIAWSGTWAVVYTVSVDASGHASCVIVHRIERGAPR